MASPPEPVSQSPAAPKLRILALPSYTAILFVLILVVVAGAALSSLLPDSQVWWPPFVLGLLLLPWRDFLHWPDREKRQHGLQPPPPEIEPLTAALDELIETANLPRPQLLIGERDVISSFGTFRRHFIAIGHELGISLTQFIRSGSSATRRGATGVLAHELAHFINRDVQLVGFARSLIKVIGLVALFNAWVAVQIVAFMILVGPEVVQPQFWRDLGQLLPSPGIDLLPLYEGLHAQNSAAFERVGNPANALSLAFFAFRLVLAYLPFAFGAAVLYLFFWRKLLRVREFYADARVAEKFGSQRAVHDAMQLYSTVQTVLRPQPRSWSGRPRTWHTWWRMGWMRFTAALTRLPLLAFRPPDAQIEAALDNPLLALGRPWQVAAWTGAAVLLLDMILRGSLTVLRITQPGAYVPVLMATAVFTIWLLPRLCQGGAALQPVRTVVTMVAVFLAVKLSMNMADALLYLLASLAGALGQLGQIIDTVMYVWLGVSVESVPLTPIMGSLVTWDELVYWQIVMPIVYYVLFALPVLVGTLLVHVWLVRRTLRWYRLAARLKAVFWLITISLLVVLALVVLPIGNRVFFAYIYQGWSWLDLLGLVVGLLWLVAAGAVFWVTDRRQAERCPQCQAMVTGMYALGRSCNGCGARLHAWLIAPY